jgi:hypothetical protein
MIVDKNISKSSNYSESPFSAFWLILDRGGKLAIKKAQKHLDLYCTGVKIEQNTESKDGYCLTCDANPDLATVIYLLFSARPLQATIDIVPFRQQTKTPCSLNIGDVESFEVAFGFMIEKSSISIEVYRSETTQLGVDDNVEAWIDRMIGEEESMAMISKIEIMEKPHEPAHFICNGPQFQEAYFMMKSKVMKNNRIH